MEQKGTENIAELVRKALAGDTESFSVLVRRYQNYAYGVAIGVLADFELARDVAQEAFLLAYRDLKKLQDPARFGGWLRGIVRHTACRALRELVRVQRIAEELKRTEYRDRQAPDPAGEEEDQAGLVRRALDGLTEKNREVVSLHYIVGMSYREIAEFLDVTEATVLGRLQRARGILRKEIEAMSDTVGKKRVPESFSESVKGLLDQTTVYGKERDRAIKELAALGSRAVDPLCAALDDPRILVRHAAARALALIGDLKGLYPILRRLYSGDESFEALLDTGFLAVQPAFRDELLKLARTGTPEEKHAAVYGLTAERGGEVTAAFLDIFRDQSLEASVRHEALVWTPGRGYGDKLLPVDTNRDVPGGAQLRPEISLG